MSDKKSCPHCSLLHYLDFLAKQPKGFVFNDPSAPSPTFTPDQVHMQQAPNDPADRTQAQELTHTQDQLPTRASQETQDLEYTQDSVNTQEQTSTSNTREQKQALLSHLYSQYITCQQCPLATMGRTQVVFSQGNPASPIMFVGEGPGRDEDIQGFPFVGRAGQLLTKIIQAMGFERLDVFISNVVRCRPPNNRTPLPTESDVCKKLILFKEIEIIQPKVICALGATAVQALLGETTRISKVRGIFCHFNNIPVMPTYHPAYLLRNPDEKKTVWEDMKKILEFLKTSKIP